MDVERLPLEFHDDGLLYCFDSDELYTGVWKKSLAGVIVEEGFYSDGLADGKWIYRNQDNSIKSTELYEDGFRISWSSPDNEHKIKNHEKPEWIKTIQQKNEDDISNAQEANSKRKEEFGRDYLPFLYLTNSFRDINVVLVRLTENDYQPAYISFPTYKMMDIEFNNLHPDKPRLLLKTNSRSFHEINIKRKKYSPKERTIAISLLGDAYWVNHNGKPKWVDQKTGEERSVTITHEAEGFYFNFRIRTTQEEVFCYPYRGTYDNNVSTQFGTDESILPMSMDKFFAVYKWVSYNSDEIPPQIGSEIYGLTGDDIYRGNKGFEGLDWVEMRRLKVIMSLFFLLFLAVVVFN